MERNLFSFFVPLLFPWSLGTTCQSLPIRFLSGKKDTVYHWNLSCITQRPSNVKKKIKWYKVIYIHYFIRILMIVYNCDWKILLP